MRKIQYLDGLRGLAAFVVVFHHFVLAFYPALFLGANVRTHLPSGEEVFLSGSMFNILYSGNFAVCIFFVLSGFVLSYKFFLQKDLKIITEGAIKRYVRLVLPVAFSVFLAFVLMNFSLFYNQQAADLSGSSWLSSFWKFAPSLKGALKETFINTFFTNELDYNVTLWTVAYEFFGAFLVFGFLLFFGRMQKRFWAYVLTIIIFWQTYYLAFVLGMFLSDLMAHENMFIKKLDKSKIVLVLLLLTGLFLGSYPSGRGVEGTVYAAMEKPYLVNSAVFYHTLGAFFVIWVLLESKRMQKFFSFKYLLFLGEISFAMYLLHFIVLGSFSSYIFLKLSPYLSYASAFGVSFVLSLGLICMLSYFVYLHVDKNSARFSRNIYQFLFKRLQKEKD